VEIVLLIVLGLVSAVSALAVLSVAVASLLLAIVQTATFTREQRLLRGTTVLFAGLGHNQSVERGGLTVTLRYQPRGTQVQVLDSRIRGSRIRLEVPEVVSARDDELATLWLNSSSKFPELAAFTQQVQQGVLVLEALSDDLSAPREMQEEQLSAALSLAEALGLYVREQGLVAWARGHQDPAVAVLAAERAVTDQPLVDILMNPLTDRDTELRALRALRLHLHGQPKRALALALELLLAGNLNEVTIGLWAAADLAGDDADAVAEAVAAGARVLLGACRDEQVPTRSLQATWEVACEAMGASHQALLIQALSLADPFAVLPAVRRLGEVGGVAAIPPLRVVTPRFLYDRAWNKGRTMSVEAEVRRATKHAVRLIQGRLTGVEAGGFALATIEREVGALTMAGDIQGGEVSMPRRPEPAKERP